MSDPYNVTVMESSILAPDVLSLLFIFQSHFDLRWEVYRGRQSCKLVRAWPRSNGTQHNQNPKSWTLVELWKSTWFSENWLPRPGCAHLVWQDCPYCPHTAYLHCAPCSGAGLTCRSPYLGAGLLFLPAPSWGTWSSPCIGSWSLVDRTASCLSALPPGPCAPPTI